jgi:two-component system, chemotaxis family, chemotaxis protein CheY
MSKTLLVVDDATILRLQIKDAACSAGWEIVGEACNGREAVECYAKCRPAAVTLDLVMPEYDGLYALRNIMAIDPKAKVVIVSALGQKSVLRDAFKLGASDFIVKPFDADALVHTLAQFAATGPALTAAV